MAPIDPSKKPAPVVALIANFCCLGILGYVLCGQTKKGVMVFVANVIASVVTFFVGGLGGLVIGIFSLIDVYQVAEALQKGETLDENEYKFELLHKVVAFIDKSAVFNGPAA